MPKTSEIDLGGAIMAIFKGETGTWKSCSACSFPGPIYIFDIDGRVKSIRKVHPTRTDIEYDTYPMDGGFDRLADKLNRLQDNCPFKTVLISSLTNLAEMLIFYSLDQRGTGERKLNTYIRKGIIEMTEIEDFGAEARGMATIIAALQNVNKDRKAHVILEAHVLTVEQRNLKTQTTTISRTLVTAGRKVAAKIPTVFDEVWHFNPKPAIQEGKGMGMQVITVNTGEDFARTALPIPQVIDITPPKANLWEQLNQHIKLEGGK